MKYLLLSMFLGLSLWLQSHPVHITVVNIEPKADKAVFEVSCKIFTDDLEHAILLYSQNNIMLTQNRPVSNIHQLLCDYIASKLMIYINNKAIPKEKIRFIKYTVVEDATWIYLEYPITSKINSLEIFNDLLNQLYPDMTNLVIINWGNEEQGLTFTKHNTRIKVQ
ncbi:MAG: hypothetical protein N2449_06415 [Bacteroidales bacterium]|nr:hypothetical protein [Bacteroidales bacterium]